MTANKSAIDPARIEARILQVLARYPLPESSIKQLLFATPEVEVMRALDRLVTRGQLLFASGVYSTNSEWKPAYEVPEVVEQLKAQMAAKFGGEIEDAITGRADEQIFMAKVGGRVFRITVCLEDSQAAIEGPQKQ
jgi:hypothetical protein